MRGPKNVAAVAAVTGAVASLIGGAVVAAGVAGATPANCQDDFFWILGQSTRRLVCDLPRNADGSWTRQRVQYTPRYYVPWRCSGSYGYMSCGGDYWVDLRIAEDTSYPVTSGNQPQGEPDHLPLGT